MHESYHGDTENVGGHVVIYRVNHLEIPASSVSAMS